MWRLVLGNDFQQFGVELHDIGFLGLAAALLILHLDLGEHLRRGEFADVVHVAAVIGRLQAHEIQLGLAQEAFDIEIGRDVARQGTDRCSTGTGSASLRTFEDSPQG
jgi:hypothetical protein